MTGAEAATLAGPGLSTAEKVCALAPDACRWPCGDPARPDFHFCGSPVAKKPYCEHHRAMAYRAPLTGSGQGAASGARQSWVAIADHEAAMTSLGLEAGRQPHSEQTWETESLRDFKCTRYLRPEGRGLRS